MCSPDMQPQKETEHFITSIKSIQISGLDMTIHFSYVPCKSAPLFSDLKSKKDKRRSLAHPSEFK